MKKRNSGKAHHVAKRHYSLISTGTELEMILPTQPMIL